MLFRKKVQKSCAYCIHGTELADGSVLCAKKGLRTPEKPCCKFRYDPLRRVPGKQKLPDFTQFTEDDFTL